MKAFAWIVCLGLFAGCRTIEGTYYESFGVGWGGATYEFQKDGSFRYESVYDVGGMRGTGHYKIRFGRIKFSFDQPIAEPIPEHKYDLMSRDSSDKGNRFVVRVKDETGIEMIGAIIELSADSARIITATDIDGVAIFRGIENFDSVSIRVKFIGYYESVVRTSLKSMRELRLQLQPRNWNSSPIDSGTVWKYGIRNVRSDTMILRKTERYYEFDDDYKRRLRWKRHRIMLGKRD